MESHRPKASIYSGTPYRLQIAIARTRQGELPPQGLNRGKRYSRASYRLQNHKRTDTQRRATAPRRQSRQAPEPAKESHRAKASRNRGKRYSGASYRLQITLTETRKGEPPPQGVNRGKRYSGASCRLQVTMAGTHYVILRAC